MLQILYWEIEKQHWFHNNSKLPHKNYIIQGKQSTAGTMQKNITNHRNSLPSNTPCTFESNLEVNDLLD